MPSQKTAAEMASGAAPVTNRSNRERRLSAAIAPTVVAVMSHRIAAPMVSEIVAASRLKISVLTAA